MSPLPYADVPFRSSPALIADPGLEHQVVLRFDQGFIVVSCNCLRYKSSENSASAQRYIPLCRVRRMDEHDPSTIWRHHMREITHRRD